MSEALNDCWKDVIQKERFDAFCVAWEIKDYVEIQKVYDNLAYRGYTLKFKL